MTTTPSLSRRGEATPALVLALVLALFLALFLALTLPRASSAAEVAAEATTEPTTPAGEPAPDDGERIPLATMLDDRPTLQDPTAHYTLYVPRQAATESPRPALLVFDPRGRARFAAEIFREAADRYGWILLSSNDTRSDTGTSEPNEKAINALWPELRRFPIDPRRIYATGFSGGAMLALMVGQTWEGSLAGVIGVGGRLAQGMALREPSFVHWGAAGAWDFNYQEMHEIDERFARDDVPHWLEIFPGRHQWISSELATEAAGWMELQAMRRGLRPVDPALVTSLWDLLAAKGRAHEESGDLVAAAHTWEQMAESFTGLRDVATAERERARIEEAKEFRALERERRKWDALESRYARDTVPLLGLAAAEPPVGSRELSGRLDLDRLLERESGDDYAAIASRRMLHQVHVQASFYLPNDYLARGLAAAARTVLEIAVEIDPTTPHVWYNLACARARLQIGHDRLAEEALHRPWLFE